MRNVGLSFIHGVIMKLAARFLASVFLLALISACSGGGGGGQSSQNTGTGTFTSTLITTTTEPRAVSAQPLGSGPYSVGSTNIEINQSSVAAGRTVGDYLTGYDDGTTLYYLSSVLLNPNDAYTFDVSVPSDALYGAQAGATLKYVALILYPTTASNNRADLPMGQYVVPKMQAAGQNPIFADNSARYPLIVWSHGRGGQPLGSDNLPYAVQLASYGYIVCVLFHGDNRFPLTTASNLTEWEQFTLRPLTVKTALDSMLAGAAFSSHIDPARIGGLGRSFGGATFMALAGGKIVGPSFFTTRSTVVDPRIKAVAGIVPFLGQNFFGLMNGGISGISTPYMSVTAANDEYTSQGDYANIVERLTGTRYLVKIDGETHVLSATASTDAMTWAIYFLNANVAEDSSAQSVIGSMNSVSGGAPDSVL